MDELSDVVQLVAALLADQAPILASHAGPMLMSGGLLVARGRC
jgi:hypothetical protein